jgi:hypothetical protein
VRRSDKDVLERVSWADPQWTFLPYLTRKGNIPERRNSEAKTNDLQVGQGNIIEFDTKSLD